MPKTTTPSPPRKTTQPAPETSEVFTLAEAAAYLRLNTEEVLRLVSEDGLPGRKVGADYRFLKTAVQDWLRTPTVAPSKHGFWETHFGALEGDPQLEEMLQEIYRQRGRPEVEE